MACDVHGRAPPRSPGGRRHRPLGRCRLVGHYPGAYRFGAEPWTPSSLGTDGRSTTGRRLLPGASRIVGVVGFGVGIGRRVPTGTPTRVHAAMTTRKARIVGHVRGHRAAIPRFIGKRAVMASVHRKAVATRTATQATAR